MKTRKTNKGKQLSAGCANHGSCKVCQGNRLHQARVAVEVAREQVRNAGV